MKLKNGSFEVMCIPGYSWVAIGGMKQYVIRQRVTFNAPHEALFDAMDFFKENRLGDFKLLKWQGRIKYREWLRS